MNMYNDFSICVDKKLKLFNFVVNADLTEKLPIHSMKDISSGIQLFQELKKKTVSLHNNFQKSYMKYVAEDTALRVVRRCALKLDSFSSQTGK
ncbi:hypothetical protein JTB14_009628 [Gonioctena quinquepunctata]|nr:hypothetical protein JTB14_009628 [Gonioctena quinquepunctata]